MNQRSLWAWGDATKLPPEDNREPLAALAEATLGFAPTGVLPYPKTDSLQIPASPIKVPEDSCFTIEDTARAKNTFGRSYADQIRGLYGNFDCAPAVVARPKDSSEVEQALAFADQHELAVVPRGGGTSVVHGVTYEAPYLSLDLGRLNRVVEVDPVSRWARVQAGVLGPDLEAQLQQHDMTLRFFPQSFEFSTLGGWIATRAGGHFATLQTHIDDLVAGIDMISPNGRWSSRPLPASGAGPSPDRMLLGSEGALGVITEATMRVRPRRMWRASVDVLFDTFYEATDALRDLAQSGLHPSNCRVLDPNEGQLHQVVGEAKAVLLLAFESTDHPVVDALKRALTIARSHGGTPRGEPRVRAPKEKADNGATAAERWKRAFFDGPYMQSTLLSLGVLVDTFETAVSWTGFRQLHEGLQSELTKVLKEVCGTGRISCRVTHAYPDGLAPYYTFAGPAKLGGELTQHAEIKAAASEVLLKLGATITHHHAVGRLHQPWYKKQAPDLFRRALRGAKAELDPKGMMNPGVLV